MLSIYEINSKGPKIDPCGTLVNNAVCSSEKRIGLRGMLRSMLSKVFIHNLKADSLDKQILL